MEQKKQMIAEWQSGEYSKAELARRYAVSRTTVYEWIRRFQRRGLAGLQPRSRAPQRQPRKTAPRVVRQIVELRAQLPQRGAGKLKAIWEEQHADQKWPARSTVAGILKQHGLTVARKRRPRVPQRQQPLSEAEGPNRLWCADFKGWFLATVGSRCEPLTICDAASRYLLCCQLVPSTGWRWVKPLFEVAFREYGLPQVIRTDNGPPFASLAVAGLSPLAVWWIRLGIWPERIDPGKPQQNGRLERLHQTLKQEAAPPGEELALATVGAGPLPGGVQPTAGARSAGAKASGELLCELAAELSGAVERTGVSAGLSAAASQQGRPIHLGSARGVSDAGVIRTSDRAGGD